MAWYCDKQTGSYYHQNFLILAGMIRGPSNKRLKGNKSVRKITIFIWLFTNLSDQSKSVEVSILDNWSPTPPLSHNFALSEN